MKPIPKFSEAAGLQLLAFGAHPDDIEFGCGGVIARQTHQQPGCKAHFVVCSRGEAATQGTPEGRTAEAQKAAEILGASVEFLDLDGDAHLELRFAYTIKVARIIREVRPAIVFAPSCVENQHPDHSRLGMLVRDAIRLARFGGLKEMRSLPPHTIGQLFFYAVTSEGEPRDIAPVVIDISDPEIVRTWTSAMEAHASQMNTRHYVDLQLTRAHLAGLRAGVEYAMLLYPNDPLVFDSLAALTRGANRF